MSRAKQFHDQSTQDLEDSYHSLRDKLYKHVNDVKREKKNDKPHLISQTKKDIARVLTILHARKGVHQQGKGD